MGEAAAAVNERPRVRRALRIRRLPLANPVNLLRRYGVAQQVVRNVLDDGIGAPPETPVTIRTTDQDGTELGQGQLSWRAAPGSVTAE
jgi:hypothetical protein